MLKDYLKLSWMNGARYFWDKEELIRFLDRSGSCILDLTSGVQIPDPDSGSRIFFIFFQNCEIEHFSSFSPAGLNSMSAVQLLTLFAECSCSTSYSPHFFLRLCFHSLFSRRVPVCKPWRVHRYTIQYNPVIDTCDVWLHPFSTSLARTVRGCLLLVPNAKSAACIHTTGVVGTHCLLVNARTASIFATSLCCRH